MTGHGSRALALDAGLTILALRGLHDRDRHYPFVERVVRPIGVVVVGGCGAADTGWLRSFLAFLARGGGAAR